MALLVVTSCEPQHHDRRTQAGMAVALEVRHTAVALTRAMASRPDPACGAYEATAPARLEVEWTVEGFLDERPVNPLLLALDERRELALDAAGGVAYLREADFRSAIGREGRREREWRYVDGHLYTRDHNLPFEGRQADVEDRERLLDEVPQVFETLVRATGDGWTVRETTAATPDGTGATQQTRRFELSATVSARENRQGERVRCGREWRVDPWLEELLARAEVVEARATVSFDAAGRPVLREGAWTFDVLDADGPARLEAAAREHLDWDAEVELIEAPESVADTSRDRLHARLGRFLRAVDRALPAVEEVGTGQGTAVGTGQGSGEGSR